MIKDRVIIAVDSLKLYPNANRDMADIVTRKPNGVTCSLHCHLSGTTEEGLRAFINKLSLRAGVIWRNEDNGVLFISLSPRWRERAMKAGATEVRNALIPSISYWHKDYPRKGSDGKWR